MENTKIDKVTMDTVTMNEYYCWCGKRFLSDQEITKCVSCGKNLKIKITNTIPVAVPTFNVDEEMVQLIPGCRWGSFEMWKEYTWFMAYYQLGKECYHVYCKSKEDCLLMAINMGWTGNTDSILQCPEPD